MAHGLLRFPPDLARSAHVTVAAGRRGPLERLIRYVNRPPVKESRLHIVADGVDLELKSAWRDGTTRIRLPTERFLDRLSALIPPPNSNQFLYGGVFAANHHLRHKVVAYSRPGVTVRKSPRRAKTTKSPNYAWADLMRHSFELDVLECQRCGGRLRHIATIQSASAIRLILQHLDQWDEDPPTARGDPSTQYVLDEDLLADIPVDDSTPDVDDDFNQDPGDDW